MSASRVRHHIGPRPDPHPEIPAAGNLVHIDHANSSRLCLDWGDRSPYTKRSLLEPLQHMSGRPLPNVAAISEKARGLTHGVRVDSTQTAAEVIFPTQQHPLLAEREAKRERIYHRKEHQILELPEYTNDVDYKFGQASKKDISVAEIMYPPPSAEDLDDSFEGEQRRQSNHRNYVISHGSYKPGQRRMYYGNNWVAPNYEAKGVNQCYDNDSSRVRDSMYWEESRMQELHSKIVSSRLADFCERHQPEIGHVHDPIKSTIAHLPVDHTFGLTIPADKYSACELLGRTHIAYAPGPAIDRHKLPPAGLPTNRHGDLEQPRHIIPKIYPNEDISIVSKITADIPGGSKKADKGRLQLEEGHVFGVPTVRNQPENMRMSKLLDSTNFGNELGAKELLYPTHRNVYGIDQLREFKRRLKCPL
ncbi:hypothetical protein BSLG_008374 [Batrachochytrium salamandrivorans]|nr:hypothetical protein BSLG_008374 [Batrachochytrium salamandrivorans]